jgi:hypothetical protein
MTPTPPPLPLSVKKFCPSAVEIKKHGCRRITLNGGDYFHLADEFFSDFSILQMK